MNPQPKPAGQPPPPSRMTLANVIQGRHEKPRRILMYGVEGVGKSSFAAGAANPIFLGPEDGTFHLDVPRFPQPGTWVEVFEAVDALRTSTHSYQHFVVDTLDWLEPLNWQHICARDGKRNIEDYDWGRGHVAALEEWRRFVNHLEQLRSERGMHILLLAHSWIKNFKNPEADNYDRYEMKLNVKAGGFLREWSDAVLFANYETLTHTDKQKRVRGISTGTRYLYTEHHAAYDAKNRYNLPEKLPLDWAAFSEAVQANQPADAAAIRARIGDLLADVTPEFKAKVEAAVAKAPTDAAYLARVLNKLAATVSAQEGAS